MRKNLLKLFRIISLISENITKVIIRKNILSHKVLYLVKSISMTNLIILE